MALARIPVAERRTVIVVQQWICFLLGIACMVSGIWGLCVKKTQDSTSPFIAWLGSAYVPALRLTAAACFGMGVMLVRQGRAADSLATELSDSKVAWRSTSSEADCEIGSRRSGSQAVDATSRPESRRMESRRLRLNRRQEK